MFVIYFGLAADITPPVCLAAFAASGIARSNPFMTGVTSVKLAISAFIVPYIFVYNDILVMVDVTAFPLILGIITALFGMMAVSSSVIGHFMRDCYIWERLVLFVAGIILIIPDLVSSTIGALLVLAIYFIQKRRKDDSGGMDLKATV